MNDRIEEIKALLKEILALSPEFNQSFFKRLLIFLKIRRLPIFQDVQKEVESGISQLKNNPEYGAIILTIGNLSKILSLFVGLTGKEAEEIGTHLESLIVLKEDSLASFLSKKTGGKISDRWNPDDHENSQYKYFTAKMANITFEYEEDFQIETESPIAMAALRGWIMDFYINKGYQLINQTGIGFLGLMFEKGDELLFINVSQLNLLLLITVNQNILNRKT